MSASAQSDGNGLVRPWARGKMFELERVEPPAALGRIIERHWIVRWDLRGREPFRQEVLPHPSINLVVELDRSWVFGVTTKRAGRMLEGTGWAVGTKFQPGAFTACSGIDAIRLTNAHVPVHTAFGQSLDPDDNQPGSIILAVQRLLAQHASIDDPALDLIAQIIGSMRRLPPGARVEEIAKANHIATRTLQRLFRRYVGVSPKWVLKRLRIHQAVGQISSRPPGDWSDFALDLGYYDHAHFIRDFRLIVGQSPARYSAEAAAATHTANAAGPQPA